MGFYDRLARADEVFFARLSNVSVKVADSPAIRGVFDDPAALAELDFGGTIEHQQLQLVIRTKFNPGISARTVLTLTDDETKTSTQYRVISSPLNDGSGLTVMALEVFSGDKQEFKVNY
ncbi:head-tail joining protein [Photobacterium leiognathi]|uniref:head-tail joining protein n=1 Tax=Photobacterium leiognathi TaxID=553611 RepID=UPI0027388A1A|nr:hypothetical protein [Photobacterium leiognathi]